LEKKLAHIDEKIKKYLEEMEECDQSETATEEENGKVKAAVEELRTRQEKYEGDFKRAS
jgi:peptidoglycan hydrolase CwlO-like protein